MKENLENKQTETNKEMEKFERKVANMQSAILGRLKNYFKQKLAKNKIPYRDLTKLSGVSTSVIADFLKDGKSMPRIETLIRLSFAIAPDDIDNMFRLMFEKPDSNTTATAEQLLRRTLMDLGLEHNDIIDARRYIRYLCFCADERKQRQQEKEQRQRENKIPSKRKSDELDLDKSNKS